MFRLGLQVLRTRWDDAIDAVRFRRALVVAVSVAVLLAVVLIVLQLTTQRLGSETAQAAAVALSCAVAGGSLVAACMPWASQVDPASTINGRAVRPDAHTIARGAVQLYVQRRPRPVRSEDREAVLHDVPLLHRGLIRRCVRMTALSVAVALGGVALFVHDHSYPFALAWIVYLAVPPELVVQLGRAERARLAALG